MFHCSLLFCRVILWKGRDLRAALPSQSPVGGNNVFLKKRVRTAFCCVFLIEHELIELTIDCNQARAMWDDIFEDWWQFITPVDKSNGGSIGWWIGIFGIFIGACFYRHVIIISSERSGRHRGSWHRGRKQIFFTVIRFIAFPFYDCSLKLIVKFPSITRYYLMRI